jgi:hypothetical protein
MPKVLAAEEMDLYDRTSPEILLFENGILVKKQKEKREKSASSLPDAEMRGDCRKKRQNVLSDVVLLETSPGKFEYLLPPISIEGEFRMPQHEVIVQRIHHYAHPSLLWVLDKTFTSGCDQ